VGILTDGLEWHAWRYHYEKGRDLECVLANYTPADAESLIHRLYSFWAGDPVGKRGIQGNPRSKFKEWEDDLHGIYANLEGDHRAHTRTKMSLWLDMLRTSRMAPEDTEAQIHLFVSHTFIVSLARGVIHAVTNPQVPPNPKSLLGDGFVAWVLGSFKGEEWAEGLLKKINEFDWTISKADVLQPLYEEIIGEKDRKKFGEYYTPNWLAEFIVGETLDDEWCDQAIGAALLSHSKPDALDGVGVLDPSCGSGTFLYFCALRLLHSGAMDRKGLSPFEKSLVVSKLVIGIDVHPVAAEMARATLARAIGWNAGGGLTTTMIYEGDSLQLHRHEDALFQPKDGEVQFESPKGVRVNIPLSFLHSPDFAKYVRRLVETAADGNECPADIVDSTAAEDQESILEVHRNLTDIIALEGDSVWMWYIVNMAGPYQISKRKVNRIVANPPWLSMSGIQDEARKRALESFAKHKSGVWTGGKNAPNFDIAQLFIVRCRELYMAHPGSDGDPAAWLVKLSALKAGQWSKFREKHAPMLAQSLDLTSLDPFASENKKSGGDARRCCILFEVRKAATLAAIHETKHVVVDCDDPQKKPRPSHAWSDVFSNITFTPTPRPFPIEQSEYFPVPVKTGANISPKVLTLIDEVIGEDPKSDTVSVLTMRSTDQAWKDVPQQEGTFPADWIRDLLRTQRLLPFMIETPLDKAIIPTAPDGMQISTNPNKNDSWREFDKIWQQYRGKGSATPKTLIQQINDRGKFKTQMKEFADKASPQKRMVLHPTAGNVMLAARMVCSKTAIDSGVQWCIAKSEEEAAYLIAILNASSLTEAFAEARSSQRHFNRTPWTQIPIPKFNPENRAHSSLSILSISAERIAHETHAIYREAGYKKKRTEIRGALEKHPVMADINAIVRDLLPDHAERKPW